MIAPRRLILSAFASGAAAVIALGAELVIADTDHYESPLWGSTAIGLWAAIGLLSSVALIALVTALTHAGVTREDDPYAGRDERGESTDG